MEQNIPIRVLQVVTQMARGGLETMLMNYDRYIDHKKVQFDFLEHREYETEFDPEIILLGGKIYRLPKLNPFGPHYLHALDRFFKTHPEYQIIHVHMDCLSSIPLKYAKKNGVPVRIAHAHSISEIKNAKYPLKMLLKKGVPENATDCIACGREAGEWMFGGHPFSVLNNAIDAEKYAYNEQVRAEVRSEFGIEPGTLAVGHVGNFGYPKNHTFLIDIFDSLLKRRQDCRLILVGGGSLQDEIRQKCAKLGIEDQVFFTGRRSDVERLLQAMDVFVFPSHYEGVSLVSIEAQAAGLPSLFSENIPSECIITEGIVKQMSLAKSADSWAAEIIEASGRKRGDTLMQIRKNGFDVKHNALRLQEFYLDKWKSINMQ